VRRDGPQPFALYLLFLGERSHLGLTAGMDDLGVPFQQPSHPHIAILNFTLKYLPTYGINDLSFKATATLKEA